MRRLAGAVALPALLATALVVAACGAPDRTPVIPGPSPAPASSAPSAPVKCTLPDTASYRPAASSAFVEQIRKRGYLVVGISSDTRLLGARDLKKNVFEGLDIEMAQAVAKAVFGSVTAQNLRFKAISAGDRVPLLQAGVANGKGGVDLVARAMTMNCQRWSQVAFGGPYFVSYLRLLVRSDDKVTSLADAGKQGKKVCATNGSTTLAKVSSVKGVKPVGVALTTDCMVLWQQGQVDAVAADDAILAGLKVQDPNAKIVGDPTVETEPYGLAVAKEHKDFAAYINGVLEQMRRNGGWQQAYKASGLAEQLGARTQPAGDYRRPLS
jgi:polar amino acid transport system substrate-binding protein